MCQSLWLLDCSSVENVLKRIKFWIFNVWASATQTYCSLLALKPFLLEAIKNKIKINTPKIGRMHVFTLSIKPSFSEHIVIVVICMCYRANRTQTNSHTFRETVSQYIQKCFLRFWCCDDIRLTWQMYAMVSEQKKNLEDIGPALLENYQITYIHMCESVCVCN